jgi:hypothetical protein
MQLFQRRFSNLQQPTSIWYYYKRLLLFFDDDCSVANTTVIGKAADVLSKLQVK